MSHTQYSGYEYLTQQKTYWTQQSRKISYINNKSPTESMQVEKSHLFV